MAEARKLVALIFEESSDIALQAASPAAEGGGGVLMDAHPQQALAALKEIEKKAEDADLALLDAVIAFRTKDGRVKIEQTKDMTAGKGAGRGGLLGLLVGLIFGGPLLGALFGLGLGALLGGRVDHGLDDEFIRDVGKSLRAGNSALLLLIDRDLKEEGMAYLKSFNARLFVTGMSQETEEAVTKAAEHDAIAQAIDAQFLSD